jgi:hypothetical protein
LGGSRGGMNACTDSPVTVVVTYVPSLDLFSATTRVMKGSFNKLLHY